MSAYNGGASSSMNSVAMKRKIMEQRQRKEMAVTYEERLYDAQNYRQFCKDTRSHIMMQKKSSL